MSMENTEVASVGSSWHQQNQWAQDHIYSKQIYKVGTKESINELLGKVEYIPPKTELGIFLRPEVCINIELFQLCLFACCMNCCISQTIRYVMDNFSFLFLSLLLIMP